MAGRVDCHCHYWALSRGDYGWLTPDLVPIHRDFGAADHDAVSGAHGVTRRVLVQAAPTVAETRYLLDCAAADGKAVGVVGWADLADPASVAVLEDLAANSLLKGVRPMLQDIADPDWIVSAPRPEVIATFKRLGLRFDALVKPRNLSGLETFIRANPDLPVIIDHAAKPALATGDDALWAEGMAGLAEIPHVHCKLSGLLTEMAPADAVSVQAAVSRLEPVFERLLGWFGPDRLAWGSDWPVVNLAADYGFWVEVTDALIGRLSPDERAAILSGTATRFYGLAGGAA